MTLEAWVAFCLTETALCFIPGPAVLFVVSVALARGGRSGIAAALGIVVGNTFYFVLSAAGIAAVIVASNELFAVVKWCGAAYLVWMGLRLLFVRRDAVAAVSAEPVHRALLRGFIVQAANPKALLFFVALLPQFIDATASIGWQVFIFAMSSVVIELVVLSIYIATAVKARELAGQRLRAPLERVGGAFLLLAGMRLALIRSSA